MRLRLLPTPGMPLSTLILRQRDRVLAVRQVTDTTTALSFSLHDVAVQDGQAVVTLGVTVPGRDACQAQLFCRMALTPDSRVVLNGAPRFTGAINGFSQPWVSRVTFYLADQPLLDASQAALGAAALVARHYRGMGTVFEIKLLPAAGTPLPEPGLYARATESGVPPGSPRWCARVACAPRCSPSRRGARQLLHPQGRRGPGGGPRAALRDHRAVGQPFPAGHNDPHGGRSRLRAARPTGQLAADRELPDRDGVKSSTGWPSPGAMGAPHCPSPRSRPPPTCWKSSSSPMTSRRVAATSWR